MIVHFDRMNYPKWSTDVTDLSLKSKRDIQKIYLLSWLYAIYLQVKSHNILVII